MSTPTDPALLSAAELLVAYRERTLSPVEVTKATLARIEKFNPIVNAYVHVDADGALAEAKASETRWMTGAPKGLVDGVPVGVKDNFLVTGMPARFGSKLTSEAAQTMDSPVGGALARARRRLPRQDHHAGIRLEGHQRQPADGPHPQPLGHAHDDRRLIERRGRVSRARHGALAARHRRRRLDPHPGSLHRLFRAEADAGPRADLSGRAARHHRPPRPADAHGCRRGAL